MGPNNQVSTLKRKMEDFLQCVVCLEVPAGHVYQCQLGHNTCEDCDRKNAVCPVCRQPHNTNKRMRNRTAEQSIEAWDFPRTCKNRIRGCDFLAKRTEFGTHEDRCEHRIVLCPDIGCNTMVPFNLVLNHLKWSRGKREVQELDMRSGRAAKINFNVPVSFCAANSIVIPGSMFQNPHGCHFTLNFQKTAGIHYAWITVIGDAELAKDFTVKMTMGKGQPTRISHRGMVFPISAKFEDIIKDKDGVLMFGEVGNRKDEFFRDENGKTSLSIFVKFLRSAVKEEKGMKTTTVTGHDGGPLPSTSRDIGGLRSFNIKTNNSEQIWVHATYVDQESDRKCSLCDFTATSEDDLTKHFMIKHKE